MRIHSAETQATITPEKALEFLVEGNLRFQKNLKKNRNVLEQVNDSGEGQFPFAVILSCIDSRTSAELIFDQGLGDIFSIRIAGNFINDDILGCMEFACIEAGAKLIVVLGHTKCGAVTAACNGKAKGYIENLISKIRPAVDAAKQQCDPEISRDDLIDKVAQTNVEMAVDLIREKSSVLSDLEKSKKIGIVGGVYDVTSGIVQFFE